MVQTPWQPTGSHIMHRMTCWLWSSGERDKKLRQLPTRIQPLLINSWCRGERMTLILEKSRGAVQDSTPSLSAANFYLITCLFRQRTQRPPIRHDPPETLQRPCPLHPRQSHSPPFYFSCSPLLSRPDRPRTARTTNSWTSAASSCWATPICLRQRRPSLLGARFKGRRLLRTRQEEEDLAKWKENSSARRTNPTQATSMNRKPRQPVAPWQMALTQLLANASFFPTAKFCAKNLKTIFFWKKSLTKLVVFAFFPQNDWFGEMEAILRVDKKMASKRQLSPSRSTSGPRREQSPCSELAHKKSRAHIRSPHSFSFVQWLWSADVGTGSIAFGRSSRLVVLAQAFVKGWPSYQAKSEFAGKGQKYPLQYLFLAIMGSTLLCSALGRVTAFILIAVVPHSLCSLDGKKPITTILDANWKSTSLLAETRYELGVFLAVDLSLGALLNEIRWMTQIECGFCTSTPSLFSTVNI